MDKSYYEHFKIIICKQIYVQKITPNEANSRDGLEYESWKWEGLVWLGPPG